MELEVKTCTASATAVIPFVPPALDRVWEDNELELELESSEPEPELELVSSEPEDDDDDDDDASAISVRLFLCGGL